MRFTKLLRKIIIYPVRSLYMDKYGCEFPLLTDGKQTIYNENMLKLSKKTNGKGDRKLTAFEKLYSFVILFAVIIGLSIGQVGQIRTSAEHFIVPLLVAMLYLTFIQIPFSELRQAFQKKKFTYTALALNFLWTPFFTWLLAVLFLSNNPELYLGFILLMITPCTDWYLIFTGIAKGNVSVSTTILPLNLLLQITLLPLYLYIFGGTTGMLEISFLVESVLIVIFIPLSLAILTNYWLKNKQKRREAFLRKTSTLPILFLSLAIVAMFASQGQLLFQHLDLLWKLMIPILLFFLINFFIGQKLGRILCFSYRDRASLSMTTLARNSPIALAIAMTAFPDQPLIALTLVIGPLIELPILTIITQVLLFKRRISIK